MLPNPESDRPLLSERQLWDLVRWFFCMYVPLGQVTYSSFICEIKMIVIVLPGEIKKTMSVEGLVQCHPIVRTQY